MDRIGLTGIDQITQVSGTITGVCHHMGGHTQLLLTPGAKVDGDDTTPPTGKDVEGHWFNAQRVVVLDAARVVLPGGQVVKAPEDMPGPGEPDTSDEVEGAPGPGA